MKGEPKFAISEPPPSGTYYTKDELRSMLPEVGERRVEDMAGATAIQLTSFRPELCTVVQVHEEHLWYRVRFDATGTCQCYKLPRLKCESKGLKGSED